MMSAWCRAARTRRGSIAVLVAVTAIPLIIALGMAVDYARLLTVRTELQRSADSAAIAGARSMITTPPNDATVTSDARMYFWANYRRDLLGSTIIGVEPSVTIGNRRTTVQVDVTAQVPLLFGGFFGMTTTDLSVSATAEKVVRSLELVLALDNSNSMSAAGRMTSLKNGASQLMDILYGVNDSTYADNCAISTVDAFGVTTWHPECREFKVLVGLVPFVAAVNARPALLTRGVLNVLMPGDAGGFGTPATNNPWKGCVEAIPGSGDIPGFVIAGTPDPLLSDAFAVNTPTYPPDVDDGFGGRIPANIMAYRWKPSAALSYFRTSDGNTFGTPNFWVPAGPLPPATAERWYLATASSGYSAATPRVWHELRGTGSGFTYPFGSADSGANREYGPNRGCGYPILPLQNSKAYAKSAIAELNFGAPTGTTIGLGFTWAWRLLSHNWRPVWQAPSTLYGNPPASAGGGAYWESSFFFGGTHFPGAAVTPVNRPADPALNPNVTKVVVLFTDAAGNEMGSCSSPPVWTGARWEAPSSGCWYYSAYGDWSGNPLGVTPATALDDQTVRVCQAMKSAGIVIFTIVLDATVNPQVEAMMKGPVGCSSDTVATAADPRFFFRAPDNVALEAAFREVGAQLTNLRLVR